MRESCANGTGITAQCPGQTAVILSGYVLGTNECSECSLRRWCRPPVSAASPVGYHGEHMEPKSPTKSRYVTETLLPTILYPLDAEDYFELAREDDEFGVHLPDPPDEK